MALFKNLKRFYYQGSKDKLSDRRTVDPHIRELAAACVSLEAVSEINMKSTSSLNARLRRNVDGEVCEIEFRERYGFDFEFGNEDEAFAWPFDGEYETGLTGEDRSCLSQ